MPSFLVLSNFDAARGPIDETRYSMTCCNLPPCTIEITDYKYRTDTAPTPQSPLPAEIHEAPGIFQIEKCKSDGT